jgi:hypothetical protein
MQIFCYYMQLHGLVNSMQTEQILKISSPDDSFTDRGYHHREFS